MMGRLAVVLRAVFLTAVLPCFGALDFGAVLDFKTVSRRGRVFTEGDNSNFVPRVTFATIVMLLI